MRGKGIRGGHVTVRHYPTGIDIAVSIRHLSIVRDWSEYNDEDGVYDSPALVEPQLWLQLPGAFVEAR